MTPLGEAALALAAKGMRVFPCLERGKEPLIHDNLNRATTNENVIRGWWHRPYNIGIATGESSGIWALDVDGDEGEQTLCQLEAEHGALPPTVEVITGGGGRHLYFRWPSGIEIRNAQCRDDLPGLDWRGNGGYTIAPPSVHPSGRHYAWSTDSASEFAEAPKWLLDLVTSKRGAVRATTPESWRTFIDMTHEGSHRGSAIARLAGLLLYRRVDPYVVLSVCQIFNAERCVAPLDGDEVKRIVIDIADREANQREGRPS